MAVYKLIQDIEAEDKLVGPLTLKSFIYALIAGFLAFIDYKLVVATGLGNLRWLFLTIFSLPMILFGVLASPLGRDQPTEVWLLSHIRFLLKPRIRIWNQNGVKELVTITAPKKVEQPLTKEFSKKEAKSRLKALATTLDSRGWAVKNVAVNETSLADYLQSDDANSERLVPASSALQSQAVVDVHPADDILDENNNPKAQRVEKLLETRDQERKTSVGKELSKGSSKTGGAKPSLKTGLYHPPPAVHQAVTPPAQTAKLKELVQSGNALSVASVAKLANQPGPAKQLNSNEVVIPLH